MKKITKILSMCILSLSFLSSCKEDNNTQFPAFGGFSIEPNKVWNPGDSVTVTAVQLTKGNLIYSAKYRWNVVVNLSDNTTETYTKTYEVVYDKDKKDPFFSFRLNEGQKGTVTIRFNADYSCSASGVPEVPNSITSEGCHGSIKIVGSSSLYGKASGTCTWNIE